MTDLTFTRKDIVDRYIALCLGIDRMLGLSTYTLLYDGRWGELIVELETAKSRLQFNQTELDNMQQFIRCLK